MFRGSFNGIWSDTCQYLQAVKVLFGSGKHWKIWLFICDFSDMAFISFFLLKGPKLFSGDVFWRIFFFLIIFNLGYGL